MEGKKFIGIGQKNTSIMLKNACDIFISIENIKNEEESDDEEEIIKEKQIIKFNKNKDIELELECIMKSFGNNKKIVISKLKKNLSSICDVKNIYSQDDYKYFDNYLSSKFSNNFRVIENNKTINIINITNLLKNINDIFDEFDKEDLNLSFIKDKLLLKDSTFDQRSYGFSSMCSFIEKIFPNEFKIIQNNQTTFIKKIAK